MKESEELISLLYETVLGRSPDPDGLLAWTALVDEGISAAELIGRFVQSDEAARMAAHRGWFRRTGTLASWSQSPLAADAAGFAVTDVGAAPLSYEPDVYGPLLRLPGARLTCFEPNPVRAAAVRDRHPTATVVERCVADGTRRSFHETRVGVTSSLYAPNPRAGEDLLEVGGEMDLVSTNEIDTVRLDDVDAAQGTHFLKLDVQAAERDVLRNGTNVLTTALAVHTELEFFPLYDDQPLGWEVWQALDAAGFDLHWFHHLQRYEMRTAGQASSSLPRRLGWGDAVFFPKPERVLELAPDDCLRLCAIWHDVYAATDHCHWLLQHHRDVEVRAYAAPYAEFAAN